MIRKICSTLAAAAIALSSSAAAESRASRDLAQALATLQLEDARLQTVGWRLATGNAAYCPDASPRIGVLLQDMRNYDNPEGVRAAIGLEGEIAIEAVAAGSPAETAGLAANDEILAIDGLAMASLPPPPRGDYARLAALHAMIDAALARTGTVTFTVRAHDRKLREITVTGQPACPGRFALRDSGAWAQADGTSVLIGRGFGKAQRAADILDNAEYAAVVAHEYAHNLLGHDAWLDRAGRSPDNVLYAEREADRLSVWLLANAGYDPATAPRLMRGRGRRNGSGPPTSPTHDAWETRAALIETELDRLHAKLLARGKADWTKDFQRE